jgi:hypothetical protein
VVLGWHWRMVGVTSKYLRRQRKLPFAIVRSSRVPLLAEARAAGRRDRTVHALRRERGQNLPAVAFEILDHIIRRKNDSMRRSGPTDGSGPSELLCGTGRRDPGGYVVAKKTIQDPFPPVFVEALAYHEAGHVFMAVLFDAPIKHVAIADRCAEPGFNAHTVFDWESRKKPMPVLCYALMCVASESSEKLSPHFDEFKSLHKKHRHLTAFALGVRNDIIHGLNTMVHYSLLGYSESTAKQHFKQEIREPAEQIIQLNAKSVVAFAEYLRQDRFVDGAEAKEVIFSSGPLTTGDVLKKYNL